MAEQNSIAEVDAVRRRPESQHVVMPEFKMWGAHPWSATWRHQGFRVVGGSTESSSRKGASPAWMN
jgi:hypothetical protein